MPRKLIAYVTITIGYTWKSSGPASVSCRRSGRHIFNDKYKRRMMGYHKLTETTPSITTGSYKPIIVQIPISDFRSVATAMHLMHILV